MFHLLAYLVSKKPNWYKSIGSISLCGIRRRNWIIVRQAIRLELEAVALISVAPTIHYPSSLSLCCQYSVCENWLSRSEVCFSWNRVFFAEQNESCLRHQFCLPDEIIYLPSLSSLNLQLTQISIAEGISTPILWTVLLSFYLHIRPSVTDWISTLVHTNSNNIIH